MTYEEIRAALVQQLDDNWPKDAEGEYLVPVYFENVKTLDLATAPDEFIKWDIEWLGGKQANISDDPFDRSYGTLRLNIFLKENLGTVKPLQQAQTLKKLFQFKTLGGTHTQAASLGGEVRKDGFYSIVLAVPFFADSNA
jgi:hypothetical protein